MNATRLIATLLCLVFLVPLAVANEGPFSGTVRQNQTRTHMYDNNPGGDPCPQVIVWYTVTLTWTPTTDTLTLSAGGQTVTATGGTASVSFEASYCTSFQIQVTGTQVANRASYTATISSGGGATA